MYTALFAQSMLVTNKRESEEGLLMDIKNQSIKAKHSDRLPMILSKLWVFLSLNYILSDLLSNMEASVLRGLLEGSIGGIP